MSQKVNPNSFRSQLQSLAYLGASGTQDTGVGSFSSPHKMKWGMQAYASTFHEDQLLEDYFQGMFRTFGFYQQSCRVERSCDQRTVHVRLSAVRTPQATLVDDPSSAGYATRRWRSPKEDIFCQGLEQGWLPSLWLKTVVDILSCTMTPSSSSSSIHTSVDTPSLPASTCASVRSLLSTHGDWNSNRHQDTELSRLRSVWPQLSLMEGSTSSESSSAASTSPWWTPRSWDATWHVSPSADSSRASYQPIVTRSLHEPKSHTTRVIVSLEPMPSLVCHPCMVADYMADQIEQSAPLQGLFQEVTQFMDTYEQASLEGTPAIQGFRLSCSGRLQKQKFSKPAEMAETMTLTRGRLPLNSFKQRIQFAQTAATNAFGTCGIKVWINYGELS